jgi:hypothetical protein
MASRAAAMNMLDQRVLSDALQPQRHYDECDDAQDGDQAGHDSGYRVRQSAD